jgi:hypothetical protein
MVEWDALVFDADEVVAELASTDSYLFASLAEEPPEVRQAVHSKPTRESAVNQALRAALPVPVPTDPATASREIGDALRTVTGRGGRGRGRRV